MKQKNSRRNLCIAFSKATYPEFRALLEEAKSPYQVMISWRCVAKGKKRNGHACIVNEGLKEDTDINASYVAENFTYIRFVGKDTIYRYCNPTEMKQELENFDRDGMTELEDGDVFTLEPPGLARSLRYSKERREGIMDGTWKVKPKGPNPNMRREPKHHFRPY